MVDSVDSAKRLTGKVFNDRYRIEELIAVGGMGAVYAATHLLLQKRVAVKVLRAEMRKNQQMVERFQREAIAASAIGHDNIVSVTDMGTTDDGSYLVMELLEGRDLADLIGDEAPLDVGTACDIALELLAGIAAAHHAGIVHRDLKPENIFLVERTFGRDRVKILDFGVSRLSSAKKSTPDVRLTTTGMIMGTPSYMSPEQARGDSNINHLTDIYAVGIILFKMLSGELPYGAHNYNVLVHKILSAETVPLRKLRPDLPPGLIAAVEKAMALEPTERFASAEELGIALAPFSTDPSQAPALPLHPPRARRSTGGGAYRPVATAETVAQSPAGRLADASGPPPAAAAKPVKRPSMGGRIVTPMGGDEGGPRAGTHPPVLDETEADRGPKFGSRAPVSFADETRDEPRRGGESNALWVGIVLAVLAVAGVGVFVWMNGRDKPADSAATETTDAAALVSAGDQSADAATAIDTDMDTSDAPTSGDKSAGLVIDSASTKTTPAQPTSDRPSAGSQRDRPSHNDPLPAEEPSARTVTISFDITPPGAKITVDGTPVSGKSFTTEAASVSASVKVEAEGYQTYVAPVSLDRNGKVIVQLKPVKKTTTEEPAKDDSADSAEPPADKPPPPADKPAPVDDPDPALGPSADP